MVHHQLKQGGSWLTPEETVIKWKKEKMIFKNNSENQQREKTEGYGNAASSKDGLWRKMLDTMRQKPNLEESEMEEMKIK